MSLRRPTRSTKTLHVALLALAFGALGVLPAAQSSAADNNPPVTHLDTLTPGTPTNVLANDSDPDPGDTLTLVAYTQPGPTAGSITCSSDGSCTWTPPADLCANPPASSDLRATYTASDGRGATAVGSIRLLSVTVCPANATVSGVKRNDLDADNQVDAGEPQLSGWTIRAFADANNNDQLDPGEIASATSAQTDASGAYTLSLAPGEYVLCEVAQAGWQQSPGQGSANVCAADSTLLPAGYPLTLTSGEQETRDFANYQPAEQCVPDQAGNAVVERFPPANLHLNGQPSVAGRPTYESNACIFLFAEQQDVVTTQTINPAKPKTSNILDTTGSVETQTIPAGSELDSYILHADALGADPPAVVTLSGSWTFEEPIVGISITDAGLNFGDSLFGLSTISYDTATREVETRAQSSNFDDVHVDPANPNRLLVTFKFQQGMDEIRVFTGTIAPTVAGVKFSDANGDGMRQGGEALLSDWTIRAYRDDNASGSLEAGETTLAAQAQTALTTGAYQLTLAPGSYVLCEVAQAGWQQTAPTSADNECGDTIAGLADGGHPVTLAAGQTLGGQDFGNRQQPSSVAGVKFSDANGDGMRQGGEALLSDWTIRAYRDDNASGSLEAGETTLAAQAQTALTTGAYQLTLAPGSYVLCEVAQAGWQQTAPTSADNECGDTIAGLADGGHPVTLAAGQTLGGQDFGNRVARGSIMIAKSTVGGDGTFAFDGPVGLPSPANGSGDFTIATTAGSGSATFGNVTPGAYAITETPLPTGWGLTALSCNDGASANPSTTTGATATVKVDPGETVTCTYTNAKLGSIMIAKSTVGGDGTFAFDGPVGLPSPANGSGDFTIATTAGSGSATFGNVTPGAYAITETPLPTGWGLTALSCNDGASANPSTTTGATATVKVDPGETVTCRYVNSKGGAQPTPRISIVKTTNGSDGPLLWVSDQITWRFVVSNTGNVALANVTVTDDKLSNSAIDCGGGSNVIANLGVGSSVTCNATGTAAEGPYQNTATATGSPPIGATVSATDKSSYTGFATGIVAPTSTTCQQFASHTSPSLVGESYLVSKGKVGSVSPGVFFYYSKIVVTASTTSFVARQSNNGSWPTLGVQQAILWKDDCTKSTVTPTTTGATTTFNTSGLKAGTYYVSIKYDPGSILGRAVSVPYPTVTYTFGTFLNGSPYLSSTRQVAFKPKT